VTGTPPIQPKDLSTDVTKWKANGFRETETCQLNGLVNTKIGYHIFPVQQTANIMTPFFLHCEHVVTDAEDGSPTSSLRRSHLSGPWTGILLIHIVLFFHPLAQPFGGKKPNTTRVECMVV
jgi:hypothetical protein